MMKKRRMNPACTGIIRLYGSAWDVSADGDSLDFDEYALGKVADSDG